MPTYPGSAAQTASGTAFSINTGTVTTPVYTLIGELINPRQTGAKNNTAEVTNLQSTAEEFISTLPSPGNWEFTCNRVTGDTGQIAVLASFNNKTKVLYKLVLPLSPAQTTTGDSYVFSAIVETFAISDIDPKKAITITGSLKVSGGTTFTAGT
jgi:hypothetical protein